MEAQDLQTHLSHCEPSSRSSLPRYNGQAPLRSTHYDMTLVTRGGSTFLRSIATAIGAPTLGINLGEHRATTTHLGEPHTAKPRSCDYDSPERASHDNTV